MHKSLRPHLIQILVGAVVAAVKNLVNNLPLGLMQEASCPQPTPRV